MLFTKELFHYLFALRLHLVWPQSVPFRFVAFLLSLLTLFCALFLPTAPRSAATIHMALSRGTAAAPPAPAAASSAPSASAGAAMPALPPGVDRQGLMRMLASPQGRMLVRVKKEKEEQRRKAAEAREKGPSVRFWFSLKGHERRLCCSMAVIVSLSHSLAVWSVLDASGAVQPAGPGAGHGLQPGPCQQPRSHG